MPTHVAPPDLPAGSEDDSPLASQRARELVDLLDLAHDAIFACDLDGRISYWNSGAEALYGWSWPEVRGRDANELLQTSSEEPLAQLRGRLLEAGRWGGELVRTCRDGTEVVIATRWALRRDAGGRPVEILETGRDVTAEVGAKEALQKSETRYRNMFQAMAVGFWELDFTAVGGLLRAWKKAAAGDLCRALAEQPGRVREAMRATRVIDVNEKTLALFRAERASLVGTSVEPFWPPQSEAVYAGSLLAAVEGKPYFEAEAAFRTADGQLFDALFTVSFPGGAVGRGTILVGIIDMTDRNRAQDALASVQAELTHATRVATLGELSASIAHEVRQPLTAIVAHGEAGQRWLGRQPPELDEARHSLTRISKEGRRAAEIIARIRAMSTKAAPSRGPLDLNDVVTEAAALTRREVAAHSIALSFELWPALPPVEADRVQMQQVVINLLVNAIQALASSGSARREVVMRTRLADEGVLLEVEDTGAGIAAGDQERVFKAFFTTKSAGMGMGLSICRSIVEAHGGSIGVVPGARAGSLFRVSLPAAAPANAGDAP